MNSKKSKNRKKRAKAALVVFLMNKGINSAKNLADADLVAIAERQLGMTPPGLGSSRSTIGPRMIDAQRISMGLEPVSPGKTKKSRVTSTTAQKFYKSYEWARARYEALKKNDGRCELCGRGKPEGATLNVDHIKPLKTHWELRCDQDNLQVLCGSCNKGKSNWDETDWRRPADEEMWQEQFGAEFARKAGGMS